MKRECKDCLHYCATKDGATDDSDLYCRKHFLAAVRAISNQYDDED